MKRAIILLMDSLGIGYSHDAEIYEDIGANTLGHILEQYPNTNLKNLSNLGLIHSLKESCKSTFKDPTFGYPLVQANKNSIYGYGVETSRGKDTPSGHWELMGCPVDFDWGYFRATQGSKNKIFPQELLDILVKKANLKGYLGICAGSGTEIIDTFGEEHIKTNKPIFYTSR